MTETRSPHDVDTIVHDMRSKPVCHQCQKDCDLINTPQHGLVSYCHGVGFDYQDKAGNTVSINDEVPLLDKCG